MKSKVTKSKEMVKVPESILLTLVAAKLKNRNLFPKLTEEAQKFLQKAKLSGLKFFFH